MILKKWLGLIAVIPGIAMAFMDQSILPVALPVIQKQFQASSVALQWSVNAYLLSIAIFVLAGGKIGDQIGHRKTFLIGISIFVFFSALCGISPNIETLVAARTFQGLGAALMYPAQTALLASLFPPQERGRANGFIVSIGSLFLIAGPMIGGYLTESLTWRWIFYINVPIAVIGIILALWFLPCSHPGKGKIDTLGFIYFAICSTTATIFFMQVQEWGFLSPKSLICVVAAILFLCLTIIRESKAAHPFLDLSLFKQPVYSAININIFFTQFILMIVVFRTIYIEEVLGFSPTQTGLITSVSSLPVFFFSFIGGYLTDKVNPKLPIALGYILLVFSFFWLAIFSTPTLPGLFLALLAFGIGIPLVFTPSYTTAMSAVPPQKMGLAFGMVSTLRNLAATIGLALIGLFVAQFEKSSPSVLGPKQSEIASFSAIHLLLGVLMVIAFIFAFAFHNRKEGHHPSV